MKKICVGDRAPDFFAVANTGQVIRLTDYLHHQAVVLFFYPKDDSPGCTMQACAFRDAYEDFATAEAVVIGVSDDMLESHRQFVVKRRLPFLLLSDSDGQIKTAFGVRKTFGLFPGRVTYVIDRQGIVRLIANSQLDVL